jgi:hypothetical protein
MPDIDTLRPNGGAAAPLNYTLVGGATLQAVTSDDSDATYARSPVADGTGANTTIVVMEFPTHTPAAGFERHRVRQRVRARQDSASGSGFVFANSKLYSQTGQVIDTLQLAVTEVATSLSGTYTSAGASQLSSASAIDFSQWIFFDSALSSDELRLVELYIDVDCRAKPSFVADVRDAAGVSQNGGTITDTNRPRLRWSSVLYDGLTPREYRIVVTNTDTGAIILDETRAGAPPSQRIIGPLANANYSVSLTIASNIRNGSRYLSDAEVVTFEVDFIQPAAPVITGITPQGCDNTEVPHMEICWTNGTPTANVYDDDPYVEIVRQDCNGLQRIFVEEGYAGCFCDRFTPFFKEGYGCAPGPALSLGPIAPSLVASGASTPDIAFAGDIEIRATVIPSNLGEQPITFTLLGQTIAAQWTEPSQKSWWLHLREGTLIFVYSTDGSNFTGLFQELDAEPGEEIKVRVTHDVNNGSGSRVTTFYQSRDGVNWDLLSTQTFGTAGTMFNSTAAVTVGYITGNNTFQFYGGIKDVEIRNSIGGTVVANPDFTDWPTNANTYVDGAGKTWTLQGLATIDAPACVPVYQARYWGLVDASLIVSDWDWIWPENVTNPAEGSVWLKGVASGNLALCLTERIYATDRPFGAFTPIGGGIPTVITAEPGGRNYSLVFSIENEQDLIDLEAIISQPLMLLQLLDQRDVWLAPKATNVEMPKVGGGRRRRLAVDCVEVEPQPVVDPASFFDAD